MARPRKTTVSILEAEKEQTPKTDLMRVMMHAQEHPMLYVGGVLFVAFCVVAGILIRASRAEATGRGIFLPNSLSASGTIRLSMQFTQSRTKPMQSCGKEFNSPQ